MKQSNLEFNYGYDVTGAISMWIVNFFLGRKRKKLENMKIKWLIYIYLSKRKWIMLSLQQTQIHIKKIIKNEKIKILQVLLTIVIYLQYAVSSLCHNNRSVLLQLRSARKGSTMWQAAAATQPIKNPWFSRMTMGKSEIKLHVPHNRLVNL